MENDRDLLCEIMLKMCVKVVPSFTKLLSTCSTIAQTVLDKSFMFIEVYICGNNIAFYMLYFCNNMIKKQPIVINLKLQAILESNCAFKATGNKDISHLRLMTSKRLSNLNLDVNTMANAIAVSQMKR